MNRILATPPPEIHGGEHAHEALAACFDRPNAKGDEFSSPVREAIARLLADPDAIHARRNAAGFIYVQLTFDPARTRPALRLHLWPGDELRAEAVPHSHTCRIDSVLLCGKMVNVDYRISPGTGYLVREALCQAEVCSHMPGSRLQDCTESRRTLLRPGDRYSIEIDDFHSSEVPAGQLTATCVRMSDFQDRPSRLVDIGVKPLDGEFVKERIPAARIAIYLEAVLSRL